MTAPRAREQADPPSPPDRRPPRRGGGSSPSPSTCASAAGRPAGPARLCGARRGLVRSARALAAAALLALSGALLLPATAQAQTETEIWSATLTVGTSTSGGTTYYGYEIFGSTGSLSPNSFTYEGNTITVNALRYNEGGGSSQLQFGLNGSLSIGNAYVLLVGSQSFDFVHTLASYDFADHGLSWSDGNTVEVRLREGNTAPVFADASATREVEENSAVGTNVGAVVTATDADNDTLTYSLEGTDAASFEIDSGTGQIKTVTGVTYDHEAPQNTYAVTVKADDDNGGTDTIAVTINVTDADEKSAKPDKPTLAAVSGSSTSLTATWTKPDLNGGPDITGYDLQYRAGATGTWMDVTHTGTAVTATVTGLTADTSYQVQVRAKNGETDSDWSDPADAVKTNAAGVTCTDNDVDLVRGSDSTEGSVQICYSNQWKSVCDDPDWDHNSAGVVCRQLGHATGTPTTGSHFGQIFPVTFWLDDVMCDGTEANLGACTHAGWGVENCAFSERAGVQCTVAASGLEATGGDGVVALTWNAPGDDAGITRHEFRHRKTGGAWPAGWKAVPDSAADEANEASHTVTGLAAGTAYDFELRIVGGTNASGADEATARTTGVAAPTNFIAMAGDAEVMLSWDAPAAGSGVTKHQYRQKAGNGSYPTTWTDIPNSAEGEANEDGYTVENLTNGTAYTFELRAVKDSTNSDAAEAGPVTPTAPGTCTLNPGDIWCGVVTVGSYTVSGFTSHGFQDARNVGDLSEKEFTYRSNSYTIDRLTVGTGGSVDELLTFGLVTNVTDDARRRLVLHVDDSGASFAFRDSDFVAATFDNHSWNDTGLDWSSATHVTLRLREDPAADASLSALTVTHSGGNVRLRPAFAPETEEYTASVANAVEEVTVTAETNVAGAMLAYLDGGGTEITDADAGTPGHQVALEVGDTVVQVKVTAADGDAMRTYRVRVTRRAADALGAEGEWRLTETEPYSDPESGRVNGTAGRAEVFHAGRWGTVCSDGIRDSTFSVFDYDDTDNTLMMVTDAEGNEVPSETTNDNEAAALICKDRGYDDGEYHTRYSKFPSGAAEADHQVADYWPPDSSYPADGPTPIWIDDLRCVPGKPALTGTAALPGEMSHCSYAGWGLHNCTHKEDAVVRCWNGGDLEPPEGGGGTLKGRFVSPPERHDGTKRIKVQVAFSEPVAESPRNVGAHGVEVEGGEVTSVSPVGGDAPGGAGTRSVGGRNSGGEDREVVWEFEIEPHSDGDVTVSIEAGRPCDEPGAICTADGRSLSEGISTTVEGPEEGPAPLTASFEDLPETHDGENTFRFRLAFSEPIAISYRSLREDAFEVTGGRVTRGKRVDGRKDLFEITVEPDGTGEVALSLPAGRECSVSGAICTWGPPRKQLTNTPAATVAGPAVETGPASLTASFVDVPAEHDGESAFTFRIAFSERVGWMNGRRLREHVVAVSGGRATSASRVDRRRDLWQVTVEPDSLADVTVALSAGAACRTPAAVCTSDGRALSNSISATVRGPVTVSVADARAEEGADETIDFAVTLSRAASGTVEVSYATADGTATAGADYTRTGGELRFAPGETAKTVSVPVLDDAHDEGEETLTLRLTAATGARIADGVATGTIENADHMPAAWLARFGRTVTDQVLDAVGERLAAPRAAGARATLAGQALPSWDGSGKAAANIGSESGAGDNAASERAPAARDRDAMAAIRDWMARAGTDAGRVGAGDSPDGRVRSRALTGRDFLTGTSFALTGGSAEAGGYAALWGRGAITRFDGREGDLSLDGEVTTGLIGADWASDRWTAGLAVGHARGTGGYREGGGCDATNGEEGNDPGASRCAGEVEATLTGLWPYGGLRLTDRLSAWGALGYGAGEMKLMPGGNVSPFTADLTMAMGAAGLRGEVLTPPPGGGLALAVKGDMRFTRTASEATKDAANKGRLEAAEADAWLVRTGIEGSRRFVLGGDTEGMVLTPSFELGARLDGGDAETGLGVDLGGGLAFAAPRQGVALDLKGRGLMAHEASGFREWGASAALTWDPRPETDRGLALRLRQSWGGSPTGGMDALLGRETLAGLAANDDGGTASAGRLEAELGFGLSLFDGGFTGTPNLGIGFSETARDYRVGWRLTSARRGDPGFQVDLDATRREAANAEAEHRLMLRGTVRW